MRLSFDRPVNPGSGKIHVDVIDMVRNALLYDSVEEEAAAVVRGTDDPFVVSLDMKRFPFYPYALFNVRKGAERLKCRFRGRAMPSKRFPM